MGKRTLIYNESPVEYIKLNESAEFYCSRCKKKKIAKKFGQYKENGIIKKLCNGCYGYLLSVESSDPQ